MLGHLNFVKYFLFGIFYLLLVPRMSSKKAHDIFSITYTESTTKQENPDPHSSTGSGETVTIVVAVCGTLLLIVGSVVIFLVVRRCRTSNENKQQGSEEYPALSDASKAIDQQNNSLASGHYVDMSRMRPPVQNAEEIYATPLEGYSQKNAEGQARVSEKRSRSHIYESMHIRREPPNKRNAVHENRGVGHAKSAYYFNFTSLNPFKNNDC